MTDTSRDVRDRLGELYRVVRHETLDPPSWADLPEGERKEWARRGRALIALAASCGLKIVPGHDDDGETK